MISVPGIRQRVIESAFTPAASGMAESAGIGIRSKTSFRHVAASRPFDVARDGATSVRSRQVRVWVMRWAFSARVSAVRPPRMLRKMRSVVSRKLRSVARGLEVSRGASGDVAAVSVAWASSGEGMLSAAGMTSLAWWASADMGAGVGATAAISAGSLAAARGGSGAGGA